LHNKANKRIRIIKIHKGGHVMVKFIENPFLPDNKVKTVVVDRRMPVSIQNKIRAEGINIIKTPYCKELYEAISSHPDILMHHIGGNEIVVAPNIYEKFKNKLKMLNLNVILGNTVLESTYPGNIAYNVGRIGKFAIHNFKYTDKRVLQKLECKNLKLINVKQGYSKCSICAVNEKAAITSDKGIAKALEAHGVDTLLIRPGYIDLPGLNYGFIGGTAGLIEQKKLFFCGNIKKHPDFKIIKNFLQKYWVDIEYVQNIDLIDLGSIIPLIETTPANKNNI
jgi:hypothetical protein